MFVKLLSLASMFLCLYTTTLNAGSQDCTAAGVQTSLNNGVQPIDIYNSCGSVNVLINRTYQGGVIAFMNTANGTGIIAAASDSYMNASQGTYTAFWHNMSSGVNYQTTGATGTAIGTGASNTSKIINVMGVPGMQQYRPYSYAGYASQGNMNGYNDWALPSADEMTQVMNNVITNQGCLNSISNEGGYGQYWSSSETSFNTALLVNCDGSQGNQYKNRDNTIRLVRYFTPMPNIASANPSFSFAGVTAGGTASDLRLANITDLGVAYGITINPTLAGTYVSAGPNNLTFTVTLPNLQAGNTYYARAYVKVGTSVAYGNTETFTYNAPITTQSPGLITSTTANLGGTIDTNITSTISARGIVYATTINPTLANTVVNMGTGTGNFQSTVTGLQSNQMYYARSFATSGGTTYYGPQLSFTTPVIQPTIATSTTTIGLANVSSGGTVTNPSLLNITQEGVAYGTSPNPTTAGTYVAATGVPATFTVTLPNLQSGSTYYARAYYTIGTNVTYGNSQSFAYNTPVTTINASQISANSATLGGAVDNSVTVSVSAKGVVYNTTGNPTLADSVVNMGTGTGSFQNTVSSLHAGQTYFVRAFATSGNTTVYGSQINFTTASQSPAVTLIFSGLVDGGSTNTYTESGFTLIGMWNGEMCATPASCIYASSYGLPSPQKAAYLALSTENFKFTNASNAPFTMTTFQLRNLNQTVTAQSITFTGYLATGGTVTYTAQTQGNTVAYQTFTMPNTFTGLSYITWNPQLTVITNVQVQQQATMVEYGERDQ